MKTHPIARFIKQQKYDTIVGYADEVGISAQYLNDILHGRCRCSADAALKVLRHAKGKIDAIELLSYYGRQSRDAA